MPDTLRPTPYALRPTDLTALRRRVGAWFDRHAKDFPWRGTRDAYAVWISEVMLQQTQVSTVRSYFTRFMKVFPTVEALAAAKEERVLRLWEGLGYYRRARQMLQAAKIIVAEFNGQFPGDSESAQRLPGVGRYTAGAILSIAYDRREPILEANTIRLFSRLLAYEGDADTTAGRETLWTLAERIVPQKSPGQFNQALMEIGREVCKSRNPDCEACPLQPYCRARQLNKQNELPRRRAKPEATHCRETAVVVRRRGKILLVKRDADERWAGLWDFPRAFDSLAQDAVDASSDETLADAIRKKYGLTVHLGDLVAVIRHSVTRFRITLECRAATFASETKNVASKAEMKWVRPSELDEYPLSSPARQLAKCIASSQGRK